MLVFFSETHRRHAPTNIVARGVPIPALEKPERADALAAALCEAGHRMIAPRDFGLESILKLHSRDYLAFLSTAYERWQEMLASGVQCAPIVQAHAFSLGRMHAPPVSFPALVHHYLGGGYAPIDVGTYPAAISSAHTAIEAAQALLAGNPLAYALCRPPGHHAYADMAGGYCYLNNVAIAAQHLVEHFGRVTILDIDVHHGNGTQALFYSRDDVMTISVHVDPRDVYPFCCGYAHERGSDRGRGWNLNLPLDRGATDTAYLIAIDQALVHVRENGSAALLVALGFDAYVGDPSAALAVSTEGFRAAGHRIGAMRLPTLLVQEGGYAVDALAANLSAFLDGLLGASTGDSS